MVILHQKWLKSQKSPKLSKFFMSILEGLKWFSEKHSRERKTFFYHSFSIFYSFFTLWTSKRHKKTAWNMVILFSSKRDSYEKCWICCKNAINVEKKIFNIFFSTWFASKFFFWMVYQHHPKKTFGKLELLLRNSQKTVFSWENMAGIL